MTCSVRSCSKPRAIASALLGVFLRNLGLPFDCAARRCARFSLMFCIVFPFAVLAILPVIDPRCAGLHLAILSGALWYQYDQTSNRNRCLWCAPKCLGLISPVSHLCALSLRPMFLRFDNVCNLCRRHSYDLVLAVCVSQARCRLCGCGFRKPCGAHCFRPNLLQV